MTRFYPNTRSWSNDLLAQDQLSDLTSSLSSCTTYSALYARCARPSFICLIRASASTGDSHSGFEGWSAAWLSERQAPVQFGKRSDAPRRRIDRSKFCYFWPVCGSVGACRSTSPTSGRGYGARWRRRSATVHGP